MIAVTGANGFIGSALCGHLRRMGQSVLTVGRSRGCQRLIGLNDGVARWTEVLQGADVLVHLASGSKHPSIMDDKVFEREICQASEDIGRAAVAAGVRRIVYLSTAEVYGAGSQDGRPYSEQDRPEPADVVSGCKLRAEDALKRISFESGIELCILRSPLVYGAGAPGPFGKILERIARGRFVPLGLCSGISRSFIGIDNLVDLIGACIERPQAARQTFNAGEGDPMAVSDFASRLSKAAGRPARLLPVPSGLLRLSGNPVRGGYARLATPMALDWSLVQRILGWTPPHSVDGQMQRAMAGLQQRLGARRGLFGRR